MKQIIKIKPLSINKAFQGKRYKTRDYLSFERELFYQLKPLKDKLKDKISLTLTFGFSNKGQDIDSSVKLTIDVLQKRHHFNDNRIYRLLVIKDIKPKGQEYITVEFG